MRKFTKGTLVFLYCAYIVCSFLPIEFTLFSGQKILGSEFLFALLNGTEFVPTWKASLIFPIGLGLGLFTTLFFSKRIYASYVNVAVNFVFSAIYIISLITGIGKGIGIEVCLGISSLILIINIFSALLSGDASSPEYKKNGGAVKKTDKKIQSKDLKSSKNNQRDNVQKNTESVLPKETKGNFKESKGNFMNAKLCPNCGKLLFANEICSCGLGESGEAHPVRTHKCEYCGKILFGNEVCNCRAGKTN